MISGFRLFFVFLFVKSLIHLDQVDQRLDKEEYKNQPKLTTLNLKFCCDIQDKVDQTKWINLNPKP